MQIMASKVELRKGRFSTSPAIAVTLLPLFILVHIGFKVKLGIVKALKKLVLTHLRLCFHSNITT